MFFSLDSMSGQSLIKTAYSMNTYEIFHINGRPGHIYVFFRRTWRGGSCNSNRKSEPTRGGGCLNTQTKKNQKKQHICVLTWVDVGPDGRGWRPLLVSTDSRDVRDEMDDGGRVGGDIRVTEYAHAASRGVQVPHPHLAASLPTPQLAAPNEKIHKHYIMLPSH